MTAQECTRKATCGVYRPHASLLSAGRPTYPPVTPSLRHPLAFPEPAGPLPASPQRGSFVNATGTAGAAESIACLWLHPMRRASQILNLTTAIARHLNSWKFTRPRMLFINDSQLVWWSRQASKWPLDCEGHFALVLMVAPQWPLGPGETRIILGWMGPSRRC